MSAALRAIYASGSIGATWAILIAILVGIGLVVRRWIGSGKIETYGVLTSFWLGCGIAVLLLQVWHFAFPIQWPALALLAVLGGLGLAWSARDLDEWLWGLWRRRKAMLAVSLVLVVWAANRAAGPCENYDTSLYHLGAVRWTATYSIVPGLGNLHDRLAFNSASHLLAAAIEWGPWHRRSFHVINGLLWVPLALQGLVGAVRVFSADRKWRAAGLFDMVCLVPAFLMAPWLSSLSTDLPASAAALAGASMLFRLLLGLESDKKAGRFQVVAICVTLALAVCFKASTVVFFLTACPLALAVYVVRARRGRQRAWPAATWAVALPAALLAAWVIRSVISSGYLVYPSTLGIDVSWRVPAAEAERHYRIIQSWARAQTSEEVTDWAWIRPWSRDKLVRRWVFLPLALSAMLLLGHAIATARRRKPPDDGGAGWLLWLPAVCAIAFWFWRGPDPRFGFAFCWTALAATAAMAFFAPGRSPSPAVTAVLLAGCVFLIQFLASPVSVVGPGPDRGLHPAPQYGLTTYTTASGLRLFVPAEGDRSGDAPLPCTPYPKPNLRLRSPGDLASGFVRQPGDRR